MKPGRFTYITLLGVIVCAAGLQKIYADSAAHRQDHRVGELMPMTMPRRA